MFLQPRVFTETFLFLVLCFLNSLWFKKKKTIILWKWSFFHLNIKETKKPYIYYSCFCLSCPYWSCLNKFHSIEEKSMLNNVHLNIPTKDIDFLFFTVEFSLLHYSFSIFLFFVLILTSSLYFLLLKERKKNTRGFPVKLTFFPRLFDLSKDRKRKKN